MASAITRVGPEFEALVPVRGSIAATVQAAVPGARVTAAFQHLPAGRLGAVDLPIEADVLVCADDDEAGLATVRLVETVPGLRGCVRVARGRSRCRVAHRRAGQRQRPLPGAHDAPPRGPAAPRGGRFAVTMQLYETARREIVPFEPGHVVTMYTCGITPYDAAHLGHAATYLTYDVLQRRLRDPRPRERAACAT